MKLFYKPPFFLLVFDLLILILSFYIVLDWFPLTTSTPFDKYSWPSFFYMLSWLILSYFFGRYRPLKKDNYFYATVKLFNLSLSNFVIFMFLIHCYYKPYSGFVLLSITIGAFVISYFFLSIYYAYRSAVSYNEVNLVPINRRPNAVVRHAIPLDDENFQELRSMITLHSSEKVLQFLDKNVDLKSGNTRVYISSDVENLKMSPNYQYSAIIELERLNNLRRINQRFFAINQKLPDNGLFVCCYESKSTRKKRLLSKLPSGINYILYSFDYIYSRILPKLLVTRKIYYFITGGNNRIFSKAEVLGRLYCFGFNVIAERKINNLTYVVAQRVKYPELIQKRVYGPLIRLPRQGKDGKIIQVYKMRTMHPFSEFLQGYVYENNSLTDGGKFYKDIRITTLGRFMRKYWLDEIPMILNFLKGEMKLVGVRPLSKHYFSLYSITLQEKRILFKPGLLPPFYADLPKTLDEIQESEMKYLNACEVNGVFKTDVKYFILILKNILFKNARSA